MVQGIRASEVPGGRLLRIKLLQERSVERPRGAHPCSMHCVVRQSIVGVRVNQNPERQISYYFAGIQSNEDLRARPSVDHEPAKERANLVRVEDVHLEHRHWVRADRLFPKLVDPELEGD